MPLSRKAAALAAGMVSVLCLPAAANAVPDANTGPDQQISRLRGSAMLTYPPSAADEVEFRVDAYARHDRPGPFPTTSWGTAYLRHYFADFDKEVWYSIRVDCLMAAGGQATVTGEIVDASPAGQELMHTRIGFSVAEGRRDLVGFAGKISPFPDDAEEMRMCTAPPPSMAARKGGYSIRDAVHW